MSKSRCSLCTPKMSEVKFDFPRFKIGDTRYARVTPEHVIIEDVLTEKAACLNYQKWRKMLDLHEEVAEEMDRVDQKLPNVNFRKHIGEYWYVSITSGFYCVDIRKFYRQHGKLKPTKTGLALRFREWNLLLDQSAEIHAMRPDIAQTVACYNSHDAYEAYKHCPECVEYGSSSNLPPPTPPSSPTDSGMGCSTPDLLVDVTTSDP